MSGSCAFQWLQALMRKKSQRKSQMHLKAYSFYADIKTEDLLFYYYESKRTRTAALRTQSRMCRLSWFLDPGGWGKAAAVGLYFIFPEICTLSL
ncbi:hypothetical protein STEG23_015787, partial [Scotinomys teguina]